MTAARAEEEIARTSSACRRQASAPDLICRIASRGIVLEGLVAGVRGRAAVGAVVRGVRVRHALAHRRHALDLRAVVLVVVVERAAHHRRNARAAGLERGRHDLREFELGVRRQQ